jgi:hypothetical protein
LPAVVPGVDAFEAAPPLNISSRQTTTPTMSMSSATAAKPIDTSTSFRSPETAPAISRPIATATTDTIAPNRIT